jgi:hypothetical protein
MHEPLYGRHNQAMSSLRHEIACGAAQLIAEEGFDYQSAKRKAYERMTGGLGGRIAASDLPSNQEIEEAVRDHLALFADESQRAHCEAMRRAALQLMQRLSAYQPVLMGALANGTATAFSVIHLGCRAESAKELAIDFLNDGISVEATELANPAGQGMVEGLLLDWQGHPVVITTLARGGLPRRIVNLSTHELTQQLNNGGLA